MRNTFLILVIVLSSAIAHSKEPLIEIARTGTTMSIKKLFDENIKYEDKRAAIDNFSILPIVSKRWTEEQFSRKTHDKPNVKNMFIVSCSETSKRWIKYRKKALIERRPIGVVVECESKEAFLELREVAQPLPVFISSADGIDEYIEHNLYPAYIHSQGVEQ